MQLFWQDSTLYIIIVCIAALFVILLAVMIVWMLYIRKKTADMEERLERLKTGIRIQAEDLWEPPGKQDSGKMIHPRSFRLNRMLKEIQQIIGRQAGLRKQTFTMVNDTKSDMVCCDKIRLRQVLLNLLSGACQCADYGGNITLRVSQEQKDGEKKYLFEVSETGCSKSGGMKPDLAFSSNLIQLMGGKLILENKQGKGSKFYFWLPITCRKMKEQHIPN